MKKPDPSIKSQYVIYNISLYTCKMLRSFAAFFLFIGGFASFLRPAFFLDPRIVGGTIVDISQHPYQLSLLRGSQYACGAVIISNKWVISAAHCINRNWAKDYKVGAESNNRYKGVYYQVKRAIPHPAYNDVTIDYDIALLEVDGEIRFNDRSQPVKLAEKELANGVMVNVTGWGAEKSSGKESEVLRGVSLPIVDRETCQNRYKPIGRHITDRMICAGYTEGGKDSCQGDSGGPLTANGTLYGIVSWGNKCAHPLFPGVYTNVADLRWWITWISGV